MSLTRFAMVAVVVLGTIAMAADVPQCSGVKPAIVVAGQTATGTMKDYVSKQCSLYFFLQKQPNLDFTLSMNGDYVYRAGQTQKMDTIGVNAVCAESGEVECSADLIFMVTAVVPTPTPTTQAPPPPPTVGSCAAVAPIAAKPSQVVTASLPLTAVPSGCSPSITVSKQPSSGVFAVASSGVYVFMAPAAEGTQTATVQVACPAASFACTFDLTFVVAVETVAPTPAPTKLVLPACAKHVVATVAVGAQLIGSLEDKALGTCDQHTFSAITAPKKGQVTLLNAAGSYSYVAPADEVVDTFTAVAACDGKPTCVADAIIVVFKPVGGVTPVPVPSGTAAPTTPVTTAPSITPPPVTTAPAPAAVTYSTTAPAVSVLADGLDGVYATDVKYFRYNDALGDQGFGYNILFYAIGEDKAAQRIVGLRWLNTKWTAPTTQSCPTCTGAATECSILDDDLYSADKTQFTSNKFPQGNCAGRVSRVALTKGPSSSASECPFASAAYLAEHEFDVRGLSAARGCTGDDFQNVTIRGVAPGSGRETKITFEGSITLQLLLANGNRPKITLTQSNYVTSAVTNGTRVGTADVCRASPYWPVLDPLGTSRPDAPHPDSNAKAGSMCVDLNDKTYGQGDWATVAFRVKDVSLRPVSVLVHPAGSNAISFFGSKAVDWKKGATYLNFRDLTAVANAGNLTHDDKHFHLVTAGYVFAFTPGGSGMSTSWEIVGEFTMLGADNQDIGSITLRQVIRTELDMPASRTEYDGKPSVVYVYRDDQSSHTMFILGALVVVVAGIALNKVSPSSSTSPRVDLTPAVSKPVTPKPASAMEAAPVEKRASDQH